MQNFQASQNWAGVNCAASGPTPEIEVTVRLSHSRDPDFSVQWLQSYAKHYGADRLTIEQNGLGTTAILHFAFPAPPDKHNALLDEMMVEIARFRQAITTKPAASQAADRPAEAPPTPSGA